MATIFALSRPAAQTSADPNLDTEEQAFVTLINNYRQAIGLAPLAIDCLATSNQREREVDL